MKGYWGLCGTCSHCDEKSDPAHTVSPESCSLIMFPFPQPLNQLAIQQQIIQQLLIKQNNIIDRLINIEGSN